MIRTPLVRVVEAKENGTIAGVPRGIPGGLNSLFVRQAYHRRDIDQCI
jgi:hypothetical protein